MRKTILEASLKHTDKSRFLLFIETKRVAPEKALFRAAFYALVLRKKRVTKSISTAVSRSIVLTYTAVYAKI